MREVVHSIKSRDNLDVHFQGCKRLDDVRLQVHPGLNLILDIIRDAWWRPTAMMVWALCLPRS